jgi:subtilisin family serine protease
MSPNVPQLDLNVLPVFDMGYSGKGVRVCVLDDGIEHTHDDLRENYVRRGPSHCDSKERV